VDAIASQVAFADQRGDPLVHHQRGGVENRILVQHRQPERHDHPSGVGQQRAQHLPGAELGVFG